MIKKILLLLCLCASHTHLRAADGDLDILTFNPLGTPGFVIDTNAFVARSVAVQTDGKIVILNQSGTTFNSQLVRYNTDGSLDLPFGIGGKFEIPGTFLTTLLIQPDGKIVAGGQSNTTGNALLVRVSSSGSLDTAFGTGGFAEGSQGEFVAVILQTNSKIVATGQDFALSDFGTRRFNADGTLDIIFESVQDRATDLALQADGKIMAGGRDNAGIGIVVRYSTDGTLDTSYGVGGTATGTEAIFNGIVIQKDGKVVATGSDLAFTNFALSRFTTSGVLDPSFGMLASGVFVGPPGFALDVVLQADQKSVVLGQTNIFPSDFQLVRYVINGTALDGTFGAGGIVTAPSPEGNVAQAGALQQDGKLIAAGQDDSFFSLVARYLNSPALTATQILVPTNGATIPSGTVIFSGIAQNPSNVYILANGIPIAGTTTDPLGTDTWTLSATITTPGTYTIQAVALYKDGNVNLASDIITITVEPPFPPTDVTGIVTCNKFVNIKECVLTVTWQASTTPNIVSYVISQNGTTLATIPATEPLTFSLCVPSPLCRTCCANAAFQNITITAVNSDGIASEAVPVTLTCPTGACC